ncbi:uncharacterized protein BJ212DRAFT_1304570 [Suillus subaureus]|uniref:Uncharacterized protein n=1 Tax=Suillus subaureus TaxID=48587 RepID=A0A9P7DUM7_9AGAM|nr:uncharacterized protein BJ212DRAFT_1304570 [Suillus subaureus]KAG1803420.1 hypothetical protein BJ212DRAFT_1304570 [Suillus subaureus]
MYKFHALGDYVSMIRQYGTCDSYSTEPGELEHRAPKAWYCHTNHKSFVKQLTQIECHQARICRIGDKSVHRPHIKISELATSPHAHHHIGLTQKYPVHIGSFLCSHQGDPAITHNITRFNFTTYDVCRGQDVINPRTPHCHKYMYGKVIGVYHINVIFIGHGMVGYTPHQMEFLWICWYAPINQDSTWETLDRVDFPPLEDEHSFDFLDPTDVLRGCHIIPRFASGKRHVDGLGASASAGDKDDWCEYLVNRLKFSKIILQRSPCPLLMSQKMMKMPETLERMTKWYGSSQESLLEQYKEMYSFREPTAFLSNAHNCYMDPAAMLDSFLFDNPSLMPNSVNLLTQFLQGNFVDLNDIDFISYLSVGHGPMLYPLYLTVHISLYAYVLTSIVHRSVFETEQMAEVPIYVNSVSSNVSSTVIHLALHPTGYYPWSNVDLTAFQAISDARNSGSILIIPALVMPGNVNAPDSANGDKYEHLIPGDPAKKAAKAEGGLKNVIGRLPKWRKAIAYLQIELRVSVCTGEIGNPHLFDFESWAAAIQLVWPCALSRANINSSDLEIVKLIKTGTYMTLETHPRIGILLIDTVQRLLQLFIRPKSNILPISLNRFAWFLTHQIAKEIMWHIVFRPTTSHSVRLVLADLEPAMFRSEEYPPFPTMSLLGSSYPTLAEVHDQLCEMAVVLVNEHDDEDHPGLMSSLAKLCNIS